MVQLWEGKEKAARFQSKQEDATGSAIQLLRAPTAGIDARFKNTIRIPDSVGTKHCLPPSLITSIVPLIFPLCTLTLKS